MGFFDKLKYHFYKKTISTQQIESEVQTLVTACITKLNGYSGSNYLSLRYLNDPRLFTILCDELGCYLPFHKYELKIKTTMEVSYLYIYFWPMLEQDRMYSIKLDPVFKYLDNNNKDPWNYPYIEVLRY